MNNGHELIPAADMPSDAIEHCDRVAYQHSAVVQSYAGFLTLDPDLQRVLQTAENIGDFLGQSPEAVLAADPGSVLGETALHAISRWAKGPDAPSVLGDFEIPGMGWAGVRVHRTDGTVVVELEPARTDHDLHESRLIAGLPALANELREHGTLESAAGAVVHQIREMTGYQRCMMYRFDASWNGEVIAESSSPDAEDRFLGLRFPARDVPASARAMFRAVPVRVTVDQNASVARLVPRFNPMTGRDLDLTRVRCRGAAGACQTYYQNMGVRSTIVMPVVIEDRLWGLISCHHDRPRRPVLAADAWLDCARRFAEEVVAHQLARERADAERAVQSAALGATNLSFEDPGWIGQIIEQADTIRQMLSSDGFLLCLADEIHSVGRTPEEPTRSRLVADLIRLSDGQPFVTNRLGDQLPYTKELAGLCAGAMVMPISSRPSQAAVWLRAEQPRVVSWAGDPRAGLAWDEAGKPHLHPRGSFRVWQQRTSGTSLDWTSLEQSIARSAANTIALLTLSWRTAQASRSKANFLANMSHEIRTPLTAILGFAELLREENSEPRHNEFLETICRNGQHLLGLINEILELSRIEAGKLTIREEPVDLRALLSDLSGLLTKLAADKDLSFSVSIGDSIPPSIRSDAQRLRQVLINLIGNAIKFTERGGITVRAEQDGSMLRIAIADTGPGLTKAEIDRVLMPFEQADASFTRRHGGTGLGLSITNHIAQLMGGSFRLSSTKGQGTVAELVLPYQASETMPPDPLGKPSNRASAARLTGRRVLIAEDGPDNRHLVTLILERAGAEVVLAENGREAIERFEEMVARGTPPDVILMDIQMPVMDGHQAINAMRARGIRTPVFAMTANALPEDRARCERSGFDGFVAKPLIAADLIRVCADAGRAAA